MFKILYSFLFLFVSALQSDDLANYNNRAAMPGVANDGLAKGDWPVFHGSYLGYSFSALDSINKKNVNKLAPAWMHQRTGRTASVRTCPRASAPPRRPATRS